MPLAALPHNGREEISTHLPHVICRSFSIFAKQSRNIASPFLVKKEARKGALQEVCFILLCMAPLSEIKKI